MTLPSRGPWTIVDAASVSTALSWPDAIESIRRALAAGLDPESEPARVDVPLAGGELLMMPAGGPRWAGVKVVSIAPGNPARSRPRIQGVYILFDGPTRTAFWMKDTPTPLSIAFWGSNGRIVSLMDMPPCSADPCPTYRPDAPFVGALEANEGFFAGHGVEVGDRVAVVR